MIDMNLRTFDLSMNLIIFIISGDLMFVLFRVSSEDS